MKRSSIAFALVCLLATIAVPSLVTAQIEPPEVSALEVPSSAATGPVIPVELEPDTIAASPEVAPAVAPAEELPADWTGEDTAKYILTPLLEPVAYLLTGLIGVFLLFLTLLIKQRFGVDVSEKHLAMLNELADAGVNLAEERAREAIKTSGEPPSGVEKGKQAVGFAVGMAKQMGLSDKLIDYLEDLVKARLGKSRG
jgi:hypothetical protein